jgi:hypothetical protein
MRVRAFIISLVLFATSLAAAQQQPASPTPPPATSAQPAQAATAQPAQAAAAQSGDVDTVDHIIAAVYDVISGPAGQPRDWNRFRSLFLPEGRLIPNTIRPDGTIVHRVLSVDDYVTNGSRAFAQQGFFESESARTQQRFADIAHVFSTYESRHEKGGQPFARGINSFQLLHDGHRWFIVTIMWQAESPQAQIPPEYLKNGAR